MPVLCGHITCLVEVSVESSTACVWSMPCLFSFSTLSVKSQHYRASSLDSSFESGSSFSPSFVCCSVSLRRESHRRDLCHWSGKWSEKRCKCKHSKWYCCSKNRTTFLALSLLFLLLLSWSFPTYHVTSSFPARRVFSKIVTSIILSGARMQ